MPILLAQSLQRLTHIGIGPWSFLSDIASNALRFEMPT